MRYAYACTSSSMHTPLHLQWPRPLPFTVFPVHGVDGPPVGVAGCCALCSFAWVHTCGRLWHCVCCTLLLAWVDVWLIGRLVRTVIASSLQVRVVEPPRTLQQAATAAAAAAAAGMGAPSKQCVTGGRACHALACCGPRGFFRV